MEYKIKRKSFLMATVFGVVAWMLSADFFIGVVAFFLMLMPAIIEVYIPYAKDNPEHLWFKRKLYGWGWTPVTWQGWLVTLLYIGLMVAFALTIDETSPTREIFFTLILPATLLTVSFLRIAYKKGESPRWQWGEKRKPEAKKE